MRLLLLAAAASLALAAAAAQQTTIATPPPARPGPDYSAVIAPPPLKHSAEADADRKIFLASRKLKGSPRWALAQQDAVLTMPQVANDTFACSLDAPISADATPRLVALLTKALRIAGGATAKPKDSYQRPRPFVAYPNAPLCAPLHDPKNWSYPSGHAAAGWGMALVLAEVAPDRAADILERGRQFGESRAFCGVHWLSDLAPGRELAAGAIAATHADPQFEADVAAARAEVAAERAAGARPARDCAKDAAALATPLPQR